MKKFVYAKRIGCGILCTVLLTACSGKGDMEKERQDANGTQEISGDEKDSALEALEVSISGNMEQNNASEGRKSAENQKSPQPGIDAETAPSEETATEPEVSEPVITEFDWAAYFDGFHGAAVIYDAAALQFNVYNRALAETRRSPCSTFKIISSLTALKNGIIDPDNSTREWSGEVFWNA